MTTENLKPQDVAVEFIEQVIEYLEVEAEVFVEDSEDELTVTVEGDDIGLLIGRRGETLDALQHLTFQVLCKEFEERKRFVLDANGYREHRREKLIDEADGVAQEAIGTGRSIALDPMTAAERRIVHQHLAERGDVQTYSEGEEPYRYLVVDPV